MKIGAYIRVSSAGQNYEMQREAISRAVSGDGVEIVWYAEKASAKTTQRAELQRMLADARAGKLHTVYVFKLDRLARSGVADTFRIVDELRGAGVTLHALADSLTIRPGHDDVTSEVLVFALGLAAKLERTARNDRIAAARQRMAARGEAWGRPSKVSTSHVQRAREMRAAGHSVRAIASALGIPRSTIARALVQAT